ncbi:MAG: hypothetical protein LBR38_06835 [Synergistaceae bacterium]|jgi:hypothetical protein|nr:hypothetical protein [Synergistaceae bacterium]
MESTVALLKELGMPILQIVVVIAMGIYLHASLSARMDAGLAEVNHRIDMLIANDIEHLKNQNKAIVFLLMKNEKLSEDDAEYVNSLME